MRRIASCFGEDSGKALFSVMFCMLLEKGEAGSELCALSRSSGMLVSKTQVLVSQVALLLSL